MPREMRVRGGFGRRRCGFDRPAFAGRRGSATALELPPGSGSGARLGCARRGRGLGRRCRDRRRLRPDRSGAPALRRPIVPGAIFGGGGTTPAATQAARPCRRRRRRSLPWRAPAAPGAPGATRCASGGVASGRRRRNGLQARPAHHGLARAASGCSGSTGASAGAAPGAAGRPAASPGSRRRRAGAPALVLSPRRWLRRRRRRRAAGPSPCSGCRPRCARGGCGSAPGPQPGSG